MPKASYRVTRLIHFSYGHRLMDYSGKCRHPHGHNGKAEVTLERAKTDKLGMVADFGLIKETIQSWIMEELDHRMLLRQDDPLVKILKSLGEPIFVMKENPTAENIARLIFGYAMKSRLPVVSVRLWETENSFADYSREAKRATRSACPALRA